MINTQTRAVLKSLLDINTSMVIDKDLYLTDQYKTVFAHVNLGSLGETAEEVGIYDVNNFLGAIELLDDPEITKENNIIKAQDENSSLQFVTSDISTLEHTLVKPSNISTTVSIESAQEFEMSSDTITKIKKAAGVFKTMNALYFVNDQNSYIKLGSKDQFSQSSNAFKINTTADLDTGRKFELPIPLEAFLKIPAVDYKVSIKYSEKKDTYRIVFSNSVYTFVFTLMK